MKGLLLSSCIFIWTYHLVFLWWNSNIQLQCNCPFPKVSLVQNVKYLVSCDNFPTSLKYNFSVASYLQISSGTFYVGINMWHICIYFLWTFFLDSSLIIYLFFICTHNILGFYNMRSSELSFPTFQV